MNFEVTLDAPFNLATAKEYFGGWLPYSPDPSAVAMGFPVEDWQASAAIVFKQPEPKMITGEVYLLSEDSFAVAHKAWQQALAVLSLDGKNGGGEGWPKVGGNDPVIGNLQAAYSFLRPVLFHSPYEAAAAFIIGHRISIKQGRAIRQTMARELGEGIQIGGESVLAFPQPQILASLDSFKSVNAEKIERLHGVAQAALDGWLDRDVLRSMPVEEALEKLSTLKGVGKFFAQGILMRGAGLQDIVPDDDVSKEAVQLAYGLAERPSYEKVCEIAEAWRPYRMWASVLLHVWLRREKGVTRR